MEVWFWLIGALVGAAVYLRIGAGLLGPQGGRVGVESVGVADVMLTTVLTVIFGSYAALQWIAMMGSTRGPAELKLDAGSVAFGGLFFLGLVAAIAISLRMRGIDVIEFAGLRKLSWGRTLAAAIVFMALALPLVVLAQTISIQILGGGQREQDIVIAFRNTPDWNVRLAVIVMAVIVAPFAEEAIFRGYLYPVLKRYFGLPAAAFATAVLFSLIHFHMPSLLPLTVLAVCLTLAYEITGTLLAPILMHAFFNGTMIVTMLFKNM